MVMQEALNEFNRESYRSFFSSKLKIDHYHISRFVKNNYSNVLFSYGYEN